MSRSALVTYSNITSNKSKRKSKIDSVIPHCFVGQVTAKQGCDYFANTDREVSANYVIGYDGSIGESVEEEYRAWTSGGNLSVNGISGADFDHRAITIEIASDTEHPYAITDKAYAALIDLLVDICKRNGIKRLLWKADKSLVGKTDQQNMGAHRWFANKACPGDYLYNRFGEIAAEVNKRMGVADADDGKPSEAEKPASGTKVLYRVQTGAFKQKANATALQKKLDAAGFDTYVVNVGGLYKVQVGAYSVQKNAAAMLEKLKAAGYSDAFITASGDAAIEEGDKVRLKSGAKTYTGGNLASFVYKRDHVVKEVSGDRAVITYGGVVVAAVNVADLSRV